MMQLSPMRTPIIVGAFGEHTLIKKDCLNNNPNKIR
jgi:hypothetical protein